ncbi:succinic semialdehyde dehydrogenase [Natranaeroarchaeum sulfidigenes]|uniref:Lactaldehyde dehydrogenase, Succinate semialdehyde dehydrogenase or other NAD-dependent aldehyde dehydrogenase n=1 Tax=Natranaeroarchaeum sulfidigenes TaxID=2784880 RepID=A0A897MTM6_9EURY|nr:succinic semialdehyde dehydrogenase [Natranaeroarchaeum sulfidigenes]QSG01575.1 Lactaldehyde dehydrogenase, Succinate semialdehyde dehydrogenase or other NAD-dependent aldehyde dehydrogenase [Natranaeroarchaeum sulfidigenes]
MSSFTPSAVLADSTLTHDRLDDLAERVRTVGERSSIDVRTPATDERVGVVPACEAADVDVAVERARSAQVAWAERTPRERAAVLFRFADLVLDLREELLDAIQIETAKAREHAFEEVLDVVNTAGYYGKDGPGLLDDRNRTGPAPFLTSAVETYEPVGVVGVISPWNYPMTLSMADVLPALLTGNAVVCKPDERTPFATLLLAELLEAAGLPEDVFSVVTGEGSVVGPALIDRVDYVAFTGGTETGRVVAERAGKNLIDCSLELGGKNPMLVLDDADVETAARGAVKGAFTNAGQLCLAPERIYVDETVYDEFLDAFVGKTRELTLGVGVGYQGDVGSLIDERQLDRVREHVDGAVEDGASVLTGGRHRPDVGPFCYEPTILEGVEPDSQVACEETFGPVVSVYPVSGVEEAVSRANDSEYGLNASVYTRDTKRGRAVARQIDCGTVCVNDPFTVGWASMDAPMGGFGDSGLGRRHGEVGLLQYVESRTIATSAFGPMERPASLPGRWFIRLSSGALRVQTRIRRWLS